LKRVGINLLWLVPGVVGGSETYTVRLLKGLAERLSNIEYTLFALPEFRRAHSDLAKTFETVYAPVSGRSKPTRVLAGENTWLAAQCRKRKMDLVHHAGGIVPLVRTARPVLTIHDLQYLYYPEYFTRSKLAYLNRMVPRSAEAARLVLTPSEFSRRTVIERLGIDPSIVIVVPHGISPTREVEAAPDVRSRYGIEGPFFLYPAATYPHKNHLVLIEALAKLVRVHPGATLVLTGSKGSTMWATARSMEGRIADEIRRLGVSGRVKGLGYVSHRDLEALYSQAVAVTFPSHFEGFGAPVLEAMSRGAPVIAANTTALPEVVGDAGYLVSPDSADDWYQAMRDLMEDEDLRLIYSKAGPERAGQFTWLHSADVLEDAYRHALETTL
jgi:glycosyltransferase involved in cell wall biosynthesis